MKCKSCGGNYAARELNCPYCGNLNPTGHLWRRERRKAEQDYETAAGQLPQLRRKMANKIINRVLLIEAALFVLLIAGMALVFYIGDISMQANAGLKKSELQSEMAELYEQERFGELYALLNDYNLDGQEHYEYMQMGLLNFDYEQFQQDRMTFFGEISDDTPDSYTISSLLDSMHDVLYPYIPAYPDITGSNAAFLQEQQADVTAFAKAVLGMTDEEIALLSKEYMTIDEEDALTAAILERRCWDAE